MRNLEKLNDYFKDGFIKKVIILIALLSFAYYINFYHKTKPSHTEVYVDDSVIFAQIADSETERSLGLSYTKELKENAGMLFIFEKIGVKNFWMRDMLFDIDIIWLDQNKNVIGFFEKVKKESYNTKFPEYSFIYKSPDNTKYVLEVPSGTIEILRIKVGDVLDFKY